MDELPVDLGALTAVLREHGVGFALLFGSQVTGRATAVSDVDLAIAPTYGLDLWALTGSLEDRVDLLDLASAPAGLAGRVAVEGIVVLDDDPVARVRWQARTRKEHLDEAWRREQFRKDFVAAHG